MVPHSPAFQDRPVLGPVQVVPPRAFDPAGAAPWTAPALRRFHGLQGEGDKRKITQSESPRFQGNPAMTSSTSSHQETLPSSRMAPIERVAFEADRLRRLAPRTTPLERCFRG